MSVDMLRVDGAPVGQGCWWGSAFKRMPCGVPLAAALFSSYALRRGSVRAARRFMRALSGKFVFHLPVHQGAERMGPAPRTVYGEVWKAHWSGSRPAEAPVINSQNPPVR